MIWFPILVKAACTAFCVVLAASLAQRLGPFWGGLIATLPVSSGPAYVLLALEHDAAFIETGSLGGYAANVGTAVYLTIYGLLAAKRSLAVAVGAALAGWGLVSYLTLQVDWTPFTATLSNILVYAVAFRLLLPVERAALGAVMTAPSRWYDAPLRAAFVVTFVLTLVTASDSLGPLATGVMAVFPVSLTSLFLLLKPRVGGLATALLAVNALRGMVGFGLMMLTLHLAIAPIGLVPAMIAALCVSLLWSLGMLLHRRRGATRRPPA